MTGSFRFGVKMTERREFRNHANINDAYLWGLLKHSTSLISRARELELAKHKITMQQMSILHALLVSNGSATIDDIATIIVRQHNSVSTIVNRMSRSGLVTIEKRPHQKKYSVQITEKARSIAEAIPRKSIEMIFTNLSLKEKELLATCLEELIITANDILGHNHHLPFLPNED
jgi:DNA-binding MarR family transcriptional regulator